MHSFITILIQIASCFDNSSRKFRKKKWPGNKDKGIYPYTTLRGYDSLDHILVLSFQENGKVGALE